MTDDTDLSSVFKALADKTRRSLLDALRRNNGQSLGELCEGIAMTRQSVTQHLDVLVAANLVVPVRHGRERRHYLNPEPIHQIERRWIRDFDRPHLKTLQSIKARAEESQDHAMSNDTSKQDQLPDYVYVTFIAATAEQVWAALTDPNATQAYWNGMANVSDWTEGSTWTHEVEGENGRYDIWGRVLRSDPPHTLAFTFQPAAQDLDDTGSLVTFLIEEAEGVVRLTLTHSNLPDAQTRQGVGSAWPTVLTSLKSYFETGTPLPPAAWQLMQG